MLKYNKNKNVVNASKEENMSYTFEITDKDGNCTEYKNIQKACYTIPVPNAKETVVEGDDLFSHRYKTSYDLYLYSPMEAYTVAKRNISIIKVTKEH